MSWPGERQRHAMSSRGVITSAGKKKIKPLSNITELPFNYEEAGYDTKTLLLIPERAELKRLTKEANEKTFKHFIIHTFTH